MKDLPLTMSSLQELDYREKLPENSLVPPLLGHSNIPVINHPKLSQAVLVGIIEESKDKIISYQIKV